MARLNINIGTTANDKTGDPLRTAFDKVNQNFVELYARTNDDIQIPSLTGNNGKILTVSGGALSWVENSGDTLTHSASGNTASIGNNAFQLNIDNNDGSDILYSLNAQGMMTLTPGEESYTDAGVEVVGNSYRISAVTSVSLQTANSDPNPSTANNATFSIGKNGGVITLTRFGGSGWNRQWNFGTDGILTLPNDGTINNTSVPGPVTGGGATVNLVPNQLGQTTSSLTVDKLGPPNSNWAVPQIGWTVTVNSTTVTITNITDDSNNVYFTLDNSVTLPITGAVTFTEPGSQGPDVLKLEITPDGTTTWSFGSDGFTTFPGGIEFDNGRGIFNPTNNGINIWDGPYEGPYNGELLLDSNGVIIFTNNELNLWQFKNDGTLEFPDGVGTTSGAIRQRTTRTVTQGITTVNASTSGIIYSAAAWQTGFKLVIMVETRLDNNTDDVDHTQICEALISANYNSDVEPVMSVYGLTYTSPSPLATFTVQRSGYTGSGSGTIEVVATNVQTQYNLQVSVHAVQFGSAYD